MINEFLQFLKKQKLANRFARADMLFLLRPLNTFQSVLPLAGLFRRPSSLSPSARTKEFLAKNQQSLPAVLAVPLALNYGIRPLPRQPQTLTGTLVFKQALPSSGRAEHKSLLAELAEKDWPQLPAENLLKILDMNLDMRLFAAELERLGVENAGNNGYAAIEIDWPQTSQQELVLGFPETMTSASELPPEAQHNLADSFFRMFFLKSLLVADWPAIAYNSRGQIAWLDFSQLLPADKTQHSFALAYLQGKALPQTPSEHSVKRALNLLEIYCPDVALPAMAEKIGCCPLADFQTADNNWAAQTLKGFKSMGLAGGMSEPYAVSNPEDVAYLLDSRRHLRDSRFKKSSFYYWAPLLLAAFALYRFF